MSGVRHRARAIWESRFSTAAAVKQITSALRGAGVAETARRESTSVLMLNQFFYPDISATAQHATDLARFLSKQGDSVTAIASRSIYGQAGSVLPREESDAGICVHRVSGSRFGRRRIAFRAIDFLAFNLACLVKALSIGRHQVTVCLTTPPYIAFVGLLLRWFKGSKFVFWTMDLYPDVPVAAGILQPGRTMHRLLDALDRLCLRHADEVVVLGRCMKERVIAKGVDPRRITVITPWADPGEICTLDGAREANPFRADWGLGDRFVIEYSGTCGIGHDFSSVCEAMVRLREDDRVRWVFAGGGVMRPTLEEFISRESIGNAMLKPYQSRDRLSQLIGLGDVHLVLIADGFSGLLVPSKFYGVMAAGKPTIYIGPRDSEVARTIEETGCGICVENGNADGVVAAVRRLREDPRLAAEMGLRGRLALERSMSTAHACQAWRSLLLRLSATTA
jgi:glycosyltransferase involved in cell wall biosynthesis